MDTNYKQIGIRIKQIRLQNKLKGSELGDILGVDKQTISNYETGKTKPPAPTLAKIAKIGTKSLDWLITGEYNTNHQGHDSIPEETARYQTDDFEQRIVGMLRRIPDESRQHLIQMITTAYFDHMETQTGGPQTKSAEAE